MIDFSLSDEQKALRELAHDFEAKEIRPVASECDRDGRVVTYPGG
jgi:acyl-CoA dehydrogenase